MSRFKRLYSENVPRLFTVALHSPTQVHLCRFVSGLILVDHLKSQIGTEQNGGTDEGGRGAHKRHQAARQRLAAKGEGKVFT